MSTQPWAQAEPRHGTTETSAPSRTIGQRLMSLHVPVARWVATVAIGLASRGPAGAAVPTPARAACRCRGDGTLREAGAHGRGGPRDTGRIACMSPGAPPHNF